MEAKRWFAFAASRLEWCKGSVPELSGVSVEDIRQERRVVV
jgi:hypothetical protein